MTDQYSSQISKSHVPSMTQWYISNTRGTSKIAYKVIFSKGITFKNGRTFLGDQDSNECWLSPLLSRNWIFRKETTVDHLCIFPLSSYFTIFYKEIIEGLGNGYEGTK